MRIEVTGFFDDRSSDRLGMESDAKLVGALATSAHLRESNIAPTSSSSRCPFGT